MVRYPGLQYRKSLKIELCAMKSKIPFSGIGQKTQLTHSKNTAPFPLLRQKINKNFLTLLRGKFNGIAHGSIIQVSTVEITMPESKPSRGTAKQIYIMRAAESVAIEGASVIGGVAFFPPPRHRIVIVPLFVAI